MKVRYEIFFSLRLQEALEHEDFVRHAIWETTASISRDRETFMSIDLAFTPAPRTAVIPPSSSDLTYYIIVTLSC